MPKHRARQPKKLILRERFRTAVHEAGHAVACHVLRRRFDLVTIEPSDDILGRLKFAGPPQTALPLVPDWRAERTIRDRIVITLAGEIAVRLVSGKAGDLHELLRTHEGRKSWTLARYIAEGDDDETALYFHWLARRTERLVAQHANAIVALMQALIERRSLSYRQARAIMTAALTRAPSGSGPT